MLLIILMPAEAALPQKHVLTLHAAGQLADAAVAEANRRKATVVITVVDDSGTPILVKRLDNTQVASVQVSIDKARTAAIFRRPSKDFEDQVRNGRVSAIALAGAVPLQGGLPVIYEGEVVGAIGVSGNSPQEDEDIARAGLEGLKESKGQSTAVTYIPRDVVSGAFDRGAPLLETPAYRVIASRRDAPGQAEIHQHETDVIYVVQGSATLVTGGELIDPKTTAPGETRGSAVRNGKTQRIGKGDVVVVPVNTPHWFTSVDAPFLYFTVKPNSP